MAKRYWEDMTPYEREEYINQDYVSLKELLLDSVDNFPNTRSDRTFWGAVQISTNEELRAMIILLHNDGYPTRDIIYHLPCSRSYVKRVVREYHKGGN